MVAFLIDLHACRLRICAVCKHDHQGVQRCAPVTRAAKHGVLRPQNPRNGLHRCCLHLPWNIYYCALPDRVFWASLTALCGRNAK